MMETIAYNLAVIIVVVGSVATLILVLSVINDITNIKTRWRIIKKSLGNEERFYVQFKGRLGVWCTLKHSGYFDGRFGTLQMAIDAIGREKYSIKEYHRLNERNKINKSRGVVVWKEEQ